MYKRVSIGSCESRLLDFKGFYFTSVLILIVEMGVADSDKTTKNVIINKTG